MRTVTIFVSWQMVTDKYGFRNKPVLLDAVRKSVKEIKKNHDIENVKIDVHESTSGVPGTPTIPFVVDERCKKDDIFIGDYTLTERYSRIQLAWAKLWKKDIKDTFSRKTERYSRSQKTD